MTAAGGPDWSALQAAIDGEVVLPQSARYDELSRPFNGRFEQLRPRAVARCASAQDVAETVAFIAREHLPVAIRSGAHCFAQHSGTRGVVLDVGAMDTVDMSGGEVRVGAGARLGDIYETLDPHAMTIPGGTCPDVGIAGLTLGGGLGILGRTYGLTSDRLVRAEIVLANGATLTCDAEHHADLFWALQATPGRDQPLLPELRRSEPDALGRRVLRRELCAVGQRESALRPDRRIPARPIDPGAIARRRKPGLRLNSRVHHA